MESKGDGEGEGGTGVAEACFDDVLDMLGLQEGETEFGAPPRRLETTYTMFLWK